jgi:hypothetical protein
MKSNIEKYKSQLEVLISKGDQLSISMARTINPKEFEAAAKKAYGDKYDEIIAKLPDFRDTYQLWYSEAHAVIKQLIPDRLSDFVRFYEKAKNRKAIDSSNYTIEDFLQGITVTRGITVIVSLSAASPQFDQQLAILKSAKSRFDSSLFDIRQLVQADLLDSELEAARELQKNKFYRAAGAIVGVVIEKHLAQVCINHSIPIAKKHPTISDFNDQLKNNAVIDVPQWRFVQHLGDLRNLCDHNKGKDPGNVEIEDLISGAEKITKTIF